MFRPCEQRRVQLLFYFVQLNILVLQQFVQFVQLGQVRKLVEPEILEEITRRCIEYRPADAFSPAGDAYEVPVQQCPKHAVYVHASNGLHLGPADRLFVRDDRKAFQGGLGEPRRDPAPVEPANPFRVIHLAAELVAVGHVPDFETVAALRVLLVQGFDAFADQVLAHVVHDAAEFGQAERRVTGEKHGFRDRAVFVQLRLVHDQFLLHAPCSLMTRYLPSRKG